MSPANFHEEGRRVINGPRPSPLRINKDSHIIQKPLKQQHDQKKPVIIYTRSPKIIHTKPRDFMALVQKLTGFSLSDQDRISGDHDQSKKIRKNSQKTCFGERSYCGKAHEDHDSSSATTDEKCGGNYYVKEIGSSGASQINKGQLINPQFSEIPLFTPNSSNLFCSSQSPFRHPDFVLPSSISPTFLEFMKELPEY